MAYLGDVQILTSLDGGADLFGLAERNRWIASGSVGRVELAWRDAGSDFFIPLIAGLYTALSVCFNGGVPLALMSSTAVFIGVFPAVAGIRKG